MEAIYGKQNNRKLWKIQRTKEKKVKHMVAEAKKASWTDFGNKRKSEIVLQNDEIFKKE